jgi:hypothetical protein
MPATSRRHPHELIGVRPDESVVSSIDNDELRTSDAVVDLPYFNGEPKSLICTLPRS